MKLAFISDIHGNATALEAVLEDIKEKSVDQIFVLGDLCYRGPEPQRSIDLVKSLDTDVIKGNADEWVVRGVRIDEVPNGVFQMMNKERDWTVTNLSDDQIDYLRHLPTELNLEFGKVNIHAFHATPNSLFEVIQADEDDHNLTDQLITNDADLFIYGHIHKPFIRHMNGKCIMNIGSVGLPFDGSNKASYGIVTIEDHQFETSIVRVDYEVDHVIRQFKDSDYPNKELMVKLLTESHV